MELVKKIVRVGNSAGVILPIEWYGGEAVIKLVKKPINIEEDVLFILKPYFSEIIGVYIAGSYARGEQEKDSDVDIIAISKNLQKEIFHGKYHIMIYPVETIEKAIKNNPLSIYPRIMEAKPIFNNSFLEELKAIKIDKSNFKKFISDTEDLIKINKKTIELDKLEGKLSFSVVYSLVLRLRGVNIANCILDNKKYSNKGFKKWVESVIKRNEGELVYDTYRLVRDNRKVKELIEIGVAEKLLDFLEKESRKLKGRI